MKQSTNKKIRVVEPLIYDKNYYLKTCLGSSEFSKTGGKKLHKRIIYLLSQIELKPSMRVLDVGCGRGDITLRIASKTQVAVGIDYSPDAIKIAKDTARNFPLSIQKKTKFAVMDIKTINFPDDYFDMVIAIDVFEHLYKEELEQAMREISRTLKKNGTLFVHTGANKTLYEFAYKYHTYPVNKILTFLDQKIKNVSYASLPKDPRTPEEKKQHVNEPTYYYLKRLFKKYKFSGTIQTEIGYIKPVKNIKKIIYNFLIAFYPFSKLYPLRLLYGWSFICKMMNVKS